MNNFQYTQPATQKASIDALVKEPTAQFIAGGTNLIDLMKHGIAAPKTLVDINNLTLRTIEQQGNTLRIGALALNSEVADSKLVLEKQPLLAQALNAGASAQIRNMATVGGNMLQRTRCYYFYDTAMPCNKRQPGSGCGALEGYNRIHAIWGTETASTGRTSSCIAVHPSDMCVALAALDATVLVSGPKGDRRIPFTDFHRLPGDTPQIDTNLDRGELIVAVDIPNNAFAKHVHYLKVRDRNSYAFALVSVAAALDLNGSTIREARLAMGGVAHKPWRLTEAEKALQGKPATTATFEQAATIAMQGAKAYEHNAFKVKMAPKAIVEALKTAAGLG
ncbi:xanthine dehydrogenase family protein subunit M [Spirosoma sp. RP8]|uniref:Xanthine dehydrogenase family protein subunit M n=1 Tax=Spirosoma liriopis TaxID=2937440 RepID=A0ABT0HR62_9BACT|nr:xanthine dehydrogenase family protein subunit M [Spirosoma liriopis]MCK8494670.1 xanthine dehydrogenase family protein subunit M [Spirosoma liriopis]